MTTKLSKKVDDGLHGDQRFVKPVLAWLDEYLVEQVMLAYNQAKAAHYAQWRSDGRRYFDHVRGVAEIIRDEIEPHRYFSKQVVANLLMIALFHDLKEDRSWVLPLKYMQKLFGSQVSDAVRLLSKDEDSKPVYFERMAASRNMVVLIVKLCDRLYNMRDLEGVLPEHKRKQLFETRGKVLPLCDVLESLLNKRQKHIAKYLRTELVKICDKVEASLK